MFAKHFDHITCLAIFTIFHSISKNILSKCFEKTLHSDFTETETLRKKIGLLSAMLAHWQHIPTAAAHCRHSSPNR